MKKNFITPEIEIVNLGQADDVLNGSIWDDWFKWSTEVRDEIPTW